MIDIAEEWHVIPEYHHAQDTSTDETQTNGPSGGVQVRKVAANSSGLNANGFKTRMPSNTSPF